MKLIILLVLATPFISCDNSTTPDQTNNIQEVKKEKKVKNVKKEEDFSVDFLSFWNIYPNKKRKKESFKCWNARLKEGISVDDLLRASENYVAQLKDMNFCMHSTTFLGPNERYKDFLAEFKEEYEHPVYNSENIVDNWEG